MTIDEWVDKGNALSKQGKYKEAIEVFDKALEINPEYVDIWINKGITLSKQGKYKEAIEVFDKALEINPEYVNAWNNKGITLSDQGKHKEAIEVFDKALKINPEYVNAWNNKGITLTDQGKYKEAIEVFDKALKINPEYINAWINKGVALFALDMYEEAIITYDKSIEINPKLIYSGLINKSKALFKLKKYKNAIKILAKVIALRIKNEIIFNILTKCTISLLLIGLTLKILGGTNILLDIFLCFLFLIFYIPIILLIMYLLFSPFLFISNWFKETNDVVKVNIFYEKILNSLTDYYKSIIKKVSIGSTGEPLCNEFNDSVKNNKFQNFMGYNSQKIHSILICANIRKEQIKRNLSNIVNIIFFGIAIIFIDIIRIFYNFMLPNYSFNETFFNISDSIISSFFNNLTQLFDMYKLVNKGIFLFIIYISVILLFIIGNVILSSLTTTNSRFKNRIRQHKRLNLIYSFVGFVGLIILLVYLLIKLILIIKMDFINFLVFYTGSLMTFSGLFLHHIMTKELVKVNKLIYILNKSLVEGVNTYFSKNQKFN